MKKHLGTIFIFISAVFWGTAGVFVTTLKSFGIGGIAVVFGRAVFTCLFLGLYILIFDKKAFLIKLADLWIFAVIGVASIVFFNFCYYKTMDYMGISIAAVLMYTAPLFVMIISVVFLGEKLTFLKVLCCLFAILGCALVSGVFGSATTLNAPGIIFGLLTGFGYSLYGIFSSILIKKGYKTVTVNFYAFAFALIGSAAFLGRQLPDTLDRFTRGTAPLITIVLMSLINTVIPYIFYAAGLKTVKPSIAIIIATIEPVVATVFDITVYKKYPTLLVYLGIVLILSAVLVLNLFGKGEIKKNETDCKCEN